LLSPPKLVGGRPKFIHAMRHGLQIAHDAPVFIRKEFGLTLPTHRTTVRRSS
jgi:hypothetical protein